VDNSIILKAADNVRILSASMVEKAKSGHPGGAMGAATAITLLFAEFLRFDPKNPQWEARDRFLMDPGHMSPLLYAELVLTGRLSLEDVKNFRQFGSITSGHPELSVEHGIENSSGPLGLGQGMAAGVAIAERYKVAQFGDILSHKTVALVSDGGIQEEIAYGVGRVAGHLKLSNLIFFYDANGVQLSCETKDVMDQDFKKQYESWGFRVLEADGENVDELRAAFKAAYAETNVRRSSSVTRRWQRVLSVPPANPSKARFPPTVSRFPVQALRQKKPSVAWAVTPKIRSKSSRKSRRLSTNA
jgi:transketolase